MAIQKIAALPAQIEGLIAGQSDWNLNKSYRPGKWTARQVIHHLADAHLHAFIRMRLVATTDHPTIQTYDQEAWAKAPDACTGPVEPSLQILKGVHARLAAFLRALPEQAFSRTGFHPERGTMSLDDLLRIYAAHGEKHLEHVRAALRSSDEPHAMGASV